MTPPPVSRPQPALDRVVHWTAGETPTDPGTRHHPLRKFVPWVLSALLLAVAARSASDVRDGIHLLERVGPRWVLLALGCEVLGYAALCTHLRLLSGSLSDARRLAPARTALVVFGLGSVMPMAPAEGIVMATSAHRRRGVDPQRSVLALALSQWFSLAGITIVTSGVAVWVAVADPRFPASSTVGAAGSASLVAVAAFAWLSWRPATAEWAALALGRIRHPLHSAPASERRQKGEEWREAAGAVVVGPVHAAALLLTMVIGWLASALCFAEALRGVVHPINLPVALLAFTLGVQATALPFLPAGAGVLEAIASSILALAKVPVPAALAAVVVYRLVGTLLPAAAGVLALLSLRWAPGAHDPTGLGGSDTGLLTLETAASGADGRPIPGEDGAPAPPAPAT
jgi:uncharacterized membrane protein YbhN (UPF0104 family)